MEPRRLLSLITVNTTGDDSGADGSDTISLRQAIEISNGTLAVSSLTTAQQSLVSVTSSPSNTIEFAIPASEPGDASQSVPYPPGNLDGSVANVPGFNPSYQTWTIQPLSPLPTITHQVIIDGYTQGQFPIPFRYPNQLVTQGLTIAGNPSGGNVTLTTSPPLPPGTVTIPYDYTAAQVQTALSFVDTANDSVVAFGGPLPTNSVTIAFTGIDYANETIPPLTAVGHLTGGTAPLVTVSVNPETAPDEITSTPNTSAATDGNSAKPRLIIDGSMTGGASGFVLDASDSILRGMVIDGFGVGVSIPNPDNVGDLIQGDDIGEYPVFPVNFDTGQPIIINGVDEELVNGQGNSLQGVLVGATNATVGGVEAQDSDVIIGNGFILVNGVITNNDFQGQGVSILPGAQGNQVLGDQIGVLSSAVSSAMYFIEPNGSDGVRIADSSNDVGGAVAGSGNVISGNDGEGVDIVGPASTRNNVLGNYIGTAPGGGFLFGSDNPGNQGDGVTIDNASDNSVGGTTSTDRNVISGNGGDGVDIFGASGARDTVQGNYIGITADGVSALGNAQAGVEISSAGNIVGPTNVISANLRGVVLIGSGATGNLVQSNLIGTNAAGTADLGNAKQGVLIDGAPYNTITGNAKGSQVISGNNIGLLIFGNAATGNQVLGNFVGTDVTGALDLGNSQAGVEIDDAPANLVGGPSTTATNRNLISANYWGVLLTGAQSLGNVVQGNFIGSDISGLLTLGNQLDGVYINDGASDSLIGGSTASLGNTIAFNRRDGVRIEDESVANAILSNSIFANLELGINLVPPANSSATGTNLPPNPPVLTAVATTITSTIITGTLFGTPNSTFTIQFFFSSPLDPTGVGEGGEYLGQTTAVTGANGIASYSANVPFALKSGQLVTATATDPGGNTSEFSSPLGEIFGTVQFSMASYTVSEGVGTATIVATRIGGSGGYFTVNYATSDGTGVAGSAYQTAAGTLTFQPGEDTQTFPVTILDNGQPEGDVFVNLGLSSPVGPIMLGNQSTAVLTILGNQPGAFQFQMSDFAVDEAAGTATITVTRDQSGLTSTVNYSTADGTALAGTDYAATSGTLTFNPGVSSQTFTIPILINPLIKGNETVLLNLSSPSPNASLGSPSSAVLVIVDDGIDRMGPEVTSVQAISGPVGVAEVVVGFNEPLNSATATDLLNYGYAVRTAGRDGKLDTKDDKLVGISSATYNPATLTVTLPLGFAVPNNTKLLFQINEATDVAGAGVGVSDLNGYLLDALGDGHPGGAYSDVVVAEPASKAVTVKAEKSSSQKPKPAKHAAKVTPAKSHPKGRSTAKRT